MRYRLVGELLRAVSRFAVIGVVGGLAGACSSDAMRFSDHPFANPYAGGKTADPRGTGSIDRPANAAAMPSGRVSSAPLAPVGVKIGSAPLRAEPPSITTPMPRESYASNTSGPGWSSEGGTAVTVSQGDSLNAISSRYGVPQAAILSANGVTAAQVTPGKRIIIPIYNASAPATVKRPAKPAPAKPAQAAAQPVQPARIVKPVAAAEPVRAMPAEPRPAPKVAKAPAPAQHAAPKVAAAPAPAKTPVRVAETRRAVIEPRTTGSVEPKAHPRPGQPAVVAAAQPAATAPKPNPKPVVARAVPTEPVRKPVAEAPKAAAPKVAKVQPAKAAEPAKPAKVAAPAKPAKAPEPQRVAAAAPAKTVAAEPAPAPREPESTGALPAPAAVAPKADFRWPARGRVISGFGGAGTNEGINISVPDGTPVKAAEAGTVAYAGSEVKGYGNLVLIRHENGYVSAYAHNGDLDVKRGQKVARGQTIAKSGQSGNVTSPQLHFEIRKGSTPIDPMPYLASN